MPIPQITSRERRFCRCWVRLQIGPTGDRVLAAAGVVYDIVVMQLHTEILGEGVDTWVVLHGLFGSGSNWTHFGRRWARDWRVFLVDQCNHGRSPRSAEFDYASMARDVQETLAVHGVERAGVIGHSMGGKVAMQLAADFPSLVSRMVVVDIAPRRYDARHTEIIDALKQLSAGETLSRVELDAELSHSVPCPVLRAFLLKSLVRRSDGRGWRWLLGLDEIRAGYASILAAPRLPAPCWVPALFVCGGESDFVLKTDEEPIRARFPDAEVARIPGAAHWVHTDAPNSFFSLVSSFMTFSL